MSNLESYSFSKFMNLYLYCSFLLNPMTESERQIKVWPQVIVNQITIQIKLINLWNAWDKNDAILLIEQI